MKFIDALPLHLLKTRALLCFAKVVWLFWCGSLKTAGTLRKNHLFKAALVSFVIALCSNSPSTAAELEDGVKAYEQGDYKLALQLLRPLAEQGVARAQNGIGVMYATGRGVGPHDEVQAAAWFQPPTKVTPEPKRISDIFIKTAAAYRKITSKLPLCSKLRPNTGRLSPRPPSELCTLTERALPGMTLRLSNFIERRLTKASPSPSTTSVVSTPEVKASSMITFRRQRGTEKRQTKVTPAPSFARCSIPQSWRAAGLRAGVQMVYRR